MGKKKWQSPADNFDDILDFNSMHFPTTPMANHFYDIFMPRTVLPSYFVIMDCMDRLSTCNKKRRELLDGVGWPNALNVKENVYYNLVKVFYSNIDIFTIKKIITRCGLHSN